MTKYDHDLAKHELNLVFEETVNSDAMRGLNHLCKAGNSTIMLNNFTPTGQHTSSQILKQCKLVKAKMSTSYGPTTASVKVYCRFNYKIYDCK